MSSRRRIAAGFAALVALTGTLIFAGANAANADGGLEFDPALDGADVTWTSSGFQFSGTSTNGGDPLVTVYEDGETPVCSGAVVANAWSCTTANPLAVGAHSFTALQAIPDLPPALDVIALDVRPAAPSYDQPNPYHVAHDSDAFFSGQTTAPDATIEVSIDGVGPTCTSGVIANPGPWSCSISLLGQDPGEYTMRVRQTVGSTWGEGSGPLIIDPPVGFAVGQPLPESQYEWAPANAFDIVGTTPAGSESISVSIDGEAFCAPVISGTTWACDNQVYPEPGAHSLSAQLGVDEPVAVNFSVLLPRPGVAEYDASHPRGTATIPFTGQTMYDGASTRVGLYPGQGEGRSLTPTSVTDCVNVGGDWLCEIDGSTLGSGGYTAIFSHFLPGDPDVGSYESWAEFVITGPALTCAFAPGSFAVTDAQGFSTSLYTLDPFAGSYLLAPPATCGTNAGNQFPEGTTFADVLYAGDWAALPPGVYELYLTGGEGGGEGEGAYDFVFTIPETPTINSVTSDGTTVTLAGIATPGNDLRVDDAVGGQLCLTSPDGEGLWECTFPKSAASVARATDIDAESRGMSSYSGDATIPVLSTASTATVQCLFSPGGLVATTTDPNVILLYSPVEPGEGTSIETFGSCSGAAGVQPASIPGYGLSTGCSPSCTLTELAPGLHSLWYMRSDSDESGGAGTDTPGFSPYQFFFRVPEAPGLASLTGTGPTVTATGSGVDGDEIRVVDQTGTELCTTTVASGGWSCTFARGSTTAARAFAVDATSGGMSAYSSPASVPIAFVPQVPPTPPNQPTTPPTPVLPTLPGPPADVKLTVEFPDLMNLKPGDHFSVTISALPEGWEVEVIMHSTPQSLGTATATGAPMTLELTVPDDIESGPHRIEVVATTPLGTSYFENADAHVTGGTAPVDEPVDEPVGGEEGATGITGGGGAADRSDPAAPSALTGSLAPLAQIIANPVTVAIAGGLALALLILVALPTELLNSSLSSNTSRLGRVYGTVDRALTRAQDWLIRFTRSRAVAAGLLVVLVAIIYGFVDPGFGFDIVSLRLVLSLAIAFFMLSFVASWISGLIIRRAWGATGVVAMQPTIILFAVIGVIVARVLDFSPGFLVGVAIGLELIQASKRVTARAVFVQLGVVTGLALTAWIAYSLFEPGNDFAGLLVEDTMVALTAEGLTGALIAIFPLKFLDGRDLWEVSKRLWVTAFLLVATSFALLVLPTAVEGTEVADYGVWLLVFAVFGVISLTVWFIFVRADKRAAAADREKVEA
jgi:hypothetical protein